MGEPPVEGTLPDPGSTGDLLHRHPCYPLLLEKGTRGLEDSTTVARSVASLHLRLHYTPLTQDVPEVQLEDLEWADAYVFGTPTRFGNVSAQLKQFLDTTGGLWFEGKLTDKVVGGFTSGQNEHGGQESTLLSMYNVFMYWGSIIVPTGYTSQEFFAYGGNPYGVSSTDREEGPTEEELAAARYQGRRSAEKAAMLAGSRVQS